MNLLLRCALVLVALGAGCGPELPLEEPPSGDPNGEHPEPPVSDAGAELDAGEPWDAGSTPDPVDAGLDEDAGTEEDAGTPPPEEVCTSSATTAPVYTGVNNDPGFLQVYVNNVENLETPADQCPGDWQDLFHYMELNPSPDVFLVQQISGQQQLDMLVQHMTQQLPGIFDAVIAEANPDAMNSPCGPAKDYQTNAIIYRTGRLTPVGSKHVWQSWAFINGECRRNFQARTRNVMQRFHDKIANRYVTVASLHWSTFQGTGADPACARKNVDEVAQKLALPAYQSDLRLFGGDMNEPDRTSGGGYRPWFARANGDVNGALGFRDPIFRKCQGGGLASCLDDNWTIGSERRIDFLFAKRADGCMPFTSRAHTITFDEADAAAKQVAGSDAAPNYSDHRAVRAAVHYQ